MVDSKTVLAGYVSKIEKGWRTGKATEHTYRGALADLFNALHPELQTLNEPQRVECGAPDYIIMKSEIPLAFIEAKDIGDGDLDGRKATGNKEQFDRYKAGLDNIVFTDYLDFHFYRNHEFVEAVRIGEIKGNKIVLVEENTGKFLALVDDLVGGAFQKIKSASQLAKLMAGKARLLEQITARMLSRKDAPTTSIGRLMDDFKRTLVPDIDAAGFADVYAQTLTYGMFAARLHDETPETFSRYEAAALIPKSNPFLKRLFTHIASDLEDEIVWAVDDLVSMFGAADVRTILKDYGRSTQQSDPMIHFYEDFLSFYDAGLRRERGVWYTPLPIVKFIVGAVDRILETHFGLADGLANRDKIEIEYEDYADYGKKAIRKQKRKVHKVQVLDPATGTGTFLAECVNRIHEKFKGHQGNWQGYVADDLLPRLNGFEILMASYTMAHVKLDFVLSNTGYAHKGGRFNVFLTNSLEESATSIGSLFASMLGEEANAAKFVKDACPVMVVMGNPPYSGESQNKGEAIMRLMEDYKKEPGGKEKLKERNPKWINDDYVKFIRLAQDYIERNGQGIVAFINPHGYLDNPTFRGMRWNLLKTFDDIYVLNLHGNAKKKETAPDGSKDENVFSIMQGVSINILVKRGVVCSDERSARRADPTAPHGRDRAPRDPSAPCVVHYADLYGKRKDKYEFLETHDIESVGYKDVEPVAPMYFFVPKNTKGEGEYNKGFSIAELFKLNGMGITSAHDEFVYGQREELIERFSRFRDADPREDLYTVFNVKKKVGWDIQIGYKNLQGCNDVSAFIESVIYRPFDVLSIFYEDSLVWRSVRKVFQHFISNENLGLCLIHNSSKNNNTPIFVTDKIVDKTILSSKDNANVFPLYLYNENMGKVEKVPNFKQEIYDKICEAVGTDATERVPPEMVFDYIYAVLHTPEYREKYKEFLKVDFPRIPYPKDAATFRELAAYGETLRNAHLLKDKHSQFEKTAAFPVAGENEVEGVRWENGCVYINDTQYFDKVDEATFDFWIGGYQPAQKWLKDRKGKTLANADCDHYQSLVLALVKTQQVMAKLSMLSKKWL